MTQAVDIHGSADYLKVPITTIRARIRAGTFPPPDTVEHGISWWTIETLDKYNRALARKKRKRAKKSL